MHVSAGLHANSNSKLTPCLQLTLTGIQRNQATSHPQEFVCSYQLRTLQIMQPINDLLINQLYSYTNILIWAVYCLPFFGLLWVNEFAIPSDNSYDKECLPSPVDISVYDHTNYQLLRVKIKQWKTGSFWRGVDIYLGATGPSLCTTKAILPYLPLKPHHCNVPLFILKDEHANTSVAFLTPYY